MANLYQEGLPPVGQVCSICGTVDVRCIEFHDSSRARKLLCCEKQCIIGKDVPVWRESCRGWHMGRTTMFDPASSKHFLLFMDGMAEWATIDPRSMSAYLDQYRENAQVRDDCPFKMFQLSPASTPRRNLLLSPPAPERIRQSGLDLGPTNQNDGRQRILKATLNIEEKGDQTKIKPLPLTAETPTRLPFATSFGNEVETPPLPSPLKHIFPSSAGDPLPVDTPTYPADIQGCSSLIGQVPTSEKNILETPLKTPRAELNPRFLMQATNNSHESATKNVDTVPQREKTNNTEIADMDTDEANRKVIPRLWSQEEDHLLCKVVQKATKPLKWPIIAKSIPERNGKQCRERYLNNLAPDIKCMDWTAEEDATIFILRHIYASKWTKMRTFLQGRTDNAIKNRFHHLRRRILKDVTKGSRFLSLHDLKKTVIAGRISAIPTGHGGGDTELTPKIHSILAYLASLSIKESGPPSHIYTFGPFRDASQRGEQCGRCLLFVPSAHCGRTICTTTGWCEACTRIPPYVHGDMLRECLNLRKCPDERAGIVEKWGDQGMVHVSV